MNFKNNFTKKINNNMKKLIVSALTISVLMSSCATILDGSKTRVHVYGYPSDSKIYFNGAYQGEGSKTFAVQKSAVKKGTAKITVTREGYKPAEITLNKKTRVGFILLDIFFGGVPLIFDIATGNLTAVRPGNVEYKLEKLPVQPKEKDIYSTQIIGKRVKFKMNNKNFEGVVIDTQENNKANIKYTDETGNINNVWKLYTEFLEI